MKHIGYGIYISEPLPSGSVIEEIIRQSKKRVRT